MKDVCMYSIYFSLINLTCGDIWQSTHVLSDYEYWMSFTLLLLKATIQQYEISSRCYIDQCVRFNRIVIIALYFRSKPSELNITFDLIPLHIVANCIRRFENISSLFAFSVTVFSLRTIIGLHTFIQKK